MNPNKPSKQLLNQVSGELRKSGTSLRQWAIIRDMDYGNLRAALSGAWDGKKALEWRKRVVLYIENCEDIKEIETGTPYRSNCGSDDLANISTNASTSSYRCEHCEQSV